MKNLAFNDFEFDWMYSNILESEILLQEMN